ncbi:MAG TPA: hypothetical protein VGG92_03380 [Caulobacteraceae bacterium]|jgi:ethanolamine utilization microcompartment shell protein EutS
MGDYLNAVQIGWPPSEAHAKGFTIMLTAKTIQGFLDRFAAAYLVLLGGVVAGAVALVGA